MPTSSSPYMPPPSKRSWLILRSRPLLIPMSTVTASNMYMEASKSHEQNDNHEIEDKHKQWKTLTDKSNRNSKSSQVQVLDAMAMAPQVMDAIAMAPQSG